MDGIEPRNNKQRRHGATYLRPCSPVSGAGRGYRRPRRSGADTRFESKTQARTQQQFAAGRHLDCTAQWTAAQTADSCADARHSPTYTPKARSQYFLARTVEGCVPLSALPITGASAESAALRLRKVPEDASACQYMEIATISARLHRHLLHALVVRTLHNTAAWFSRCSLSRCW